MSEDNNDYKSDPGEEPLAIELRELEMYKDFLRRYTYPELAEKYGVTKEAVYLFAKRHGWKEKRKKAKENAYKKIDSSYKEQVVDLVKFIDTDLSLLMKRCEKEKREMTKEERQYVLSLLEKFTKETKLSEGKPTEITDGSQVVRHEIILPPGVKRFGVIPPPPNVIQVETTEVEQIENVAEDKKDAYDILEDDDET